MNKLYLHALHKQFIRFAFNKSSSRRLLKRKRYFTAKWNPIDMDHGNPLQVLTDAMTYNATVQINYRNSGWRTILPYGWNSSKEGNVLLMCYKDTGEIRSYRLDRINDLLINDSLLEMMPGDRPDEPSMHLSFNDFKIPTLPNIDEIIDETEAEIDEEQENLPYDAGLKALTENEIDETYQPVDTINDESAVSSPPTDEESDEEEIDEEDLFINNEEDENDKELIDNEDEEKEEDLDLSEDDNELNLQDAFPELKEKVGE